MILSLDCRRGVVVLTDVFQGSRISTKFLLKTVRYQNNTECYYPKRSDP